MISRLAYIFRAVVCSALLAVAPARAAEPAPGSNDAPTLGLTALAGVSDPEPTVVEDVELRVSVSAPDGAVVITPAWDEALPDELDLESVRTPGVTRTASGGVSQTWTLLLTPLAPGTYEIAPITITANLPGTTEPMTVTTDAVTITVRSILTGDDEELAGIKDPAAPPVDLVRLAAYAGGALAVLALLAGGAVMISRRRAHQPSPPPPPAHQVALDELDALLATDLIDRRRWKFYFGELSGLLRRYIEARFALHAPTQTTEEFLRDPRTSRMFSAEHDAMLRAFLGRADAVKFAEGAVTGESARAAAEDVRRFITETAEHESERSPGHDRRGEDVL